MPDRAKKPARRVLFVDDERSTLLAFQDLARSLGFEVELATTGKQALELASARSFPVVAVDLMLPDMNGITLAEQIARIDPATKFIIITSDASHGRRSTVDGSIVSLMEKPWKETELSDLLAETFDLVEQSVQTGDLRSPTELSVLLIEDSPTDALLITDCLEASSRCRLCIVPRLQDALEHLHDEAVDTIITDLSLPDARGLDAVLQLRTAAPEATLIVVSGSSDDALALRAIRRGAQEFVAKDKLDPESFARVLRIARERRRSELRLARLAFYDPLTGLANRTAFNDQLARALRRVERAHCAAAVFLIDLDGFKAVNDTLGHAAGDALLREVGRRLTASLRGYDTVARLGGDEFAAIVTDVRDAAHAREIAQRVLTAVAEPYPLEGGTGRVTASIGVAVVPGASATIDALLACADGAMYTSKRTGKNTVTLYTGCAA